MMDCLLAKCIPCVTDCVMAELEKLGSKYRLALRLAKDPRFERLPCTHKGTYADDCLLQRCQQKEKERGRRFIGSCGDPSSAKFLPATIFEICTAIW